MPGSKYQANQTFNCVCSNFASLFLGTKVSCIISQVKFPRRVQELLKALPSNKHTFCILGKVEIHVQERLLYWKDVSARIEESLTAMEAGGDENIKDFVAQIQRELFRLVRLLIMQYV